MPAHNNAQFHRLQLPMRWAPVQIAAAAVATLFLLIGVLGFIPGATAHYDQLGLAGHRSEAMLLGLFNVSVLHNVLHLGFGATGVVMARRFFRARNYLILGGGVYVVLWLYGLLLGGTNQANVIPLNNADNWFHLGSAAVMIVLGLTLRKRRSDTAAVGQVSAINISR